MAPHTVYIHTKRSPPCPNGCMYTQLNTKESPPWHAHANGCIYTVQLLRLLYHVKSILSAWVHDQLFLRHSLIFNSLITIAYNIIYKGAVVSGTASIHNHISDLFYFNLHCITALNIKELWLVEHH